MPQMVLTQSVTLVRDGKRITPPIGEAYDFTDEEIQQIQAASPDAIREPRDESKSAAPMPSAPRTTIGEKGEDRAADANRVRGEAPQRAGAKAAETADDDEL